MSSAIDWITKDSANFPPVANALTDPNGLLALGDDLSPNRIRQAYQQGIFPWFSDGDPVMWWSPDPRAVIFTDGLIINKSLRKFLKKSTYRVSLNKSFDQVIEYCADAPFRQDDTWIVQPMLAAYKILHKQGIAHSIEVWQDTELVGGLYGVAVNGYFSGESMFYRKPNASKVALVNLVSLLKPLGVQFIDCQLQNPFLASMGCIEVSRDVFIKAQQKALTIKPTENFWTSRML